VFCGIEGECSGETGITSDNRLGNKGKRRTGKHEHGFPKGGKKRVVKGEGFERRDMGGEAQANLIHEERQVQEPDLLRETKNIGRKEQESKWP